MRYAPCELTDSFHLLRMEKLLFKFLLLGDVPDDMDQAYQSHECC